ncbi:sulfotransferase 1C4-like [Pieris brassicae]|uniref:sulfotransferase 1C4-like n=1 Tax=Pieris brassicae TaxID=7116 RepID=UPI001E65F45D|nr:sulfotransferase 1C4-like [Pieris brassicae]
MADAATALKIKELDQETQKTMRKLFTGERGGFVRIGPKGYLVTERYKEMAADIYNMEIRPDDVWVVTYARSGTTWTQELVWMVANDLDYKTSKAIVLPERFPFLEHAMMLYPSLKQEILEEKNNDPHVKKVLELFSEPFAKPLASTPSPRFIKSHLPISLLSPKLLDAKVVYVARDPRDAAVSFWHMGSSLRTISFDGDFKTYWNLFIKDLLYWTPFFEHLKEAWEQRNNPNLLFIFYEELQKDLKGVVHRVADFLGKTYTEEQIIELCDHLNFKNFKTNPAVNSDLLRDIGLVHNKHEFIRKGKTGGWRDYFDEEMTAQADKWMEVNLRDTDLRFLH